MRLFRLVRDEDVTGVSGTGVVAEGIQFTDGAVVLRWVGKNPTSVVFHDNGIESIKAIHGHDGKTRVVFDDQTPLSTVEVVQHMIADVDRAIHGITTARDVTPQDMWKALLEEIRSAKS